MSQLFISKVHVRIAQTLKKEALTVFKENGIVMYSYSMGVGLGHYEIRIGAYYVTVHKRALYNDSAMQEFVSWLINHGPVNATYCHDPSSMYTSIKLARTW